MDCDESFLSSQESDQDDGVECPCCGEIAYPINHGTMGMCDQDGE